MKKALIILGNHVHARVLKELAEMLNYTILGFVDIYNHQCANPKEALGGLQDIYALYQNYDVAYFVIGTANSIKRRQIAEQFHDLPYVSLISPNAFVASSAKIKAGSVILHGSVVNTNAKIGRHTIINCNSTVEHDNIIGDYVHLSPGVTCGGSVHIKENTDVGMNSTLRNEITISSHITIGMGSVVTKSLVEPGVYFGNPARKVRD